MQSRPPIDWSKGDAASAIDALMGEVAKLPTGDATLPMGSTSLVTFVHLRATAAGLVAEPAELLEDDVDAFLKRCPPSLLVLSDGALLCVVGRDGSGVRVLGPDRRVVTRTRAEVAIRLRADAASRARSLAESLQEHAPELRALPKLEGALREELSRGVRLASGFTFRDNVGTSTRRTLASLGLPGHLTRLFAMSTVQSLLGTATWAIIGTLALHGHAELGSLAGWALLSLTALVMQVGATRFVGRFTVRAATRLRTRLLEGALALESDDLGAFGLGGLMVISTQADQFLNSILTMFLAVLATITSVGSTVAILSVAPQARLSIPLFGVAVAAVAAVTPWFFRAAVEQQGERVRLTTEMVERMLGHRTRLVQQTPKSWHEGEDASLEAYARRLAKYDRAIVYLRAAPRAYFLASLAAVFLVLVASPTQEALALVLGGISLGMVTLSSLCDVTLSGGELYAQWKTIAPVVRDAKELAGHPSLGTVDVPRGEKVIELRSVRFGYPNRDRVVLESENVEIRQGDRVLIEGGSGGGKTTLASLLAGLRKPSSGLVLVKGVDQHTISEIELRKAIASAPQFYKNHIFTGSLAWNLLLGRHWPPAPDDLRDARAVCDELGLGPLVDRMPGGLFQQVGETGWQLSHGERSRVFLARTLLQGADVVLLDETFGALDPATLEQCMATCLRRSPTLMVITHR